MSSVWHSSLTLLFVYYLTALPVAVAEQEKQFIIIMKKFSKILFAMVVATSAILMTGCVTKEQATVHVKVTTALGAAVSGETVYQFDQTTKDAHGLTTKMFAKATAVTDAEGVAEFSLNSLDFGVDDRVTLYYVTYDNEGNINGQTAVTVKKGENKEVSLKKAAL